MGWASAGDIFDPVAQALIDLDAAPAIKRRVLGTLLDKLRDGDWDTTEGSLQAFRHDLGVVQVFYEHNECNRLGDHPEGVLGYDPRANVWTLTCRGLREACGPLATGDGSSAQAHNDLIHAWVGHERDQHGGDGEIPTWMLLNPEP